MKISSIAVAKTIAFILAAFTLAFADFDVGSGTSPRVQNTCDGTDACEASVTPSGSVTQLSGTSVVNGKCSCGEAVPPLTGQICKTQGCAITYVFRPTGGCLTGPQEYQVDDDPIVSLTTSTTLTANSCGSDDSYLVTICPGQVWDEHTFMITVTCTKSNCGDKECD